MKMFTLACPRCGASLAIEDGIDSFYCQYCGAKIIVEGMSKSSINAKVRVKEMEHKERLKAAEYEQERYVIDRADKADRRESKISVFMFLALAALLAGIFGYVFLSHNSAVSDLEKLESTVLAEIDSGDYEAALRDAEKIRLDDNYSSEDTQWWNDRREYYVALINEKKRDEEINNPDYAFSPKSASDFEGLTGDEAKSVFENAGFINVQLVEVAGGAGWFKPAHLVEHIIFNGKQDFTVEDCCRKDARIVIYFYAE